MASSSHIDGEFLEEDCNVTLHHFHLLENITLLKPLFPLISPLHAPFLFCFAGNYKVTVRVPRKDVYKSNRQRRPVLMGLCIYVYRQANKPEENIKGVATDTRTRYLL